MKIQCMNCEQTETVNKDFFLKLFGASMAGMGFYAWLKYIFAGTGCALLICVAMMSGGIAILAFKEEIMEVIFNQKYKCSKCGSKKWSS